MFRFRQAEEKLRMPAPDEVLPGRSAIIQIEQPHRVLGTPLHPPFPEGVRQVQFGMGCFWGAERRFWQLPGIHTTAAGYSGGLTTHPTYDDVCSGRTGHAETVLVAYHTSKISLNELLRVFWESHDPTQGMRQGNDVGTQYRSVIYCENDAGLDVVIKMRDAYQRELNKVGYGTVTTEIARWQPFYYAEPHHQQYLQVHPDGYCGLRGTGVCLPR